MTQQLNLDVHHEIIIDNFAGGGGASCGIEMALGRRVDIAINHDPQAIAMHSANHPETRHYCESVWEVNPREVEPGRPIGLLWLSPDCKHHSKAKGGKPVEKNIRALAWVALRWAAVRHPRVIMLENVEEFQDWGPLVKDSNGDLRPCKKRKGREFNAFVNALRRQGYVVDWKELRACDFGAPTIRKRLFLIARCDGRPIVWPTPTHGDPKNEAVKKKRLKPWRTAAECIDFSLPCPSIFERAKPLAEATLRRIAKGIMRYVVNAAEPFIVGAGGPSYSGKPVSVERPFGALTTENHRALAVPFLTEHANSSNQRNMGVADPLRTQCAEVKGGHFAMVAPTLVQTGYGERDGQSPRAPGLDKPLGTVVAGGQKHALVSAFLAKHYTGVVGAALTDPAPTVTSVDHNSLVAANLVHYHSDKRDADVRASGPRDPLKTQTTENRHAIVTSNLVKLRGDNVGQPSDAPLATVSAGGTHHAEVRAFLMAYYGTDQDPKLQDPMHTVTTKDRYGLVTVHGQQYAIADIGLRMLAPRELFRAQGFPESYIIGDNPAQGLSLTKSAQVRMCGNSVCPPLAAALVRANLAEIAIRRTA
jgi:DNA (cytosine-5)-methyltransferase 1